MRVLVTGAAGFIGSHVARALVGAGHEVFGVVRPGHDTDRLADLDGTVHVVEADLVDRSQAHRAILETRPEGLVHAAWYVEPGKYLHAADENAAALGMTGSLFDAALAAGCQRIVNVGTGFEPAAGGAGGGVAPPQESVYRSAKTAVHDLVAELAAGGVAATCAHVFYLYGPDEYPDRLVPLLIRAALAGDPIEVTDGLQRRDYLHVDDIAAGLVTVLENSTGPSVDVCSGAPIEVRELYDAVGEATGRRELIRDGARPYGEGEVLMAAGDDAELRALGWSPAISLHDGIAQCVDAWRNR